MRHAVLCALILGICSIPALAQAPKISVDPVECFPEEYVNVVNAMVKPEVGGTTPRLFFRWNEHGDMYYVDMFTDGGGNYWGIPARPENRNDRIEFYVAVVDPTGKTLARTESLFSEVEEDCRVDLTPRQVGVANNLVIGETVQAQEGQEVLGFLCDGIVTRINYQGIMRPDEVCRGCVIPWWVKEEYIAPAAVGIGAVTTIITEREPSPARP